MRREQNGALKVSYGSKMRQTSHKSCIEDLKLDNLNHTGYMGITARNQDRNVKGIEVSLAKVMNMDPLAY